MPVTAKERETAQDELHQLCAYARNINAPSVEARLRAIANAVDIKLDDDEIERRRRA